MLLKKKSISTNVTVGLVIIVTFLVAGTLWVQYYTQKHSGRTKIEKKAGEYAADLATILAVPLWTLDTENTKYIGKVYEQNKLFTSLNIKDNQGNSIFSFGTPLPPELCVRRTQKINFEGETIGQLEITLSLKPHYDELDRLTTASLLTLTLAALIILVTTGTLLRIFMRNPLADLEKGMASVSRGDFTGQTIGTGHSELENIVATFKKMATTIYARESALQLMNKTLTREMTERKAAESIREKLIGELKSKNDELERFTYTVSHDLKSPIITIKGFLGMLERDLAEGDAKRIDSDIKRIHQATDKMQLLLDELLKLSRIGRQVNPPENIDLNELLLDVTELLFGRLEKGGIAVNISPDLPTIRGDRPRILEVFQNIMDNAAKFMGEQGNPSIEIGECETSKGRAIFIKDNGMGIKKEHLNKIFGLFDQLNPKLEGTGIGLALVQRIIDTHGGAVWVESDGLKTGTTFYLTLPKAIFETSKASNKIAKQGQQS